MSKTLNFYFSKIAMFFCFIEPGLCIFLASGKQISSFYQEKELIQFKAIYSLVLYRAIFVKSKLKGLIRSSNTSPYL
jgi:hypothetical protein